MKPFKNAFNNKTLVVSLVCCVVSCPPGLLLADTATKTTSQTCSQSSQTLPFGPEGLGIQAVMVLPPYPGAKSVYLDGNLSTGGVPLDAEVFQTKHSIDRVLEYYRQFLGDKDVHKTEHRFGPLAGYIGFFDIHTGKMRLANVMGTGQGTMIILSAMDPAPLVMNQMNVPEDLPTLPGAHQVVHTKSEQNGAKSRTVSFRVLGKPEEVQGALHNAAQDKGFRRAPKQYEIESSALTLKRGRETCIIRTMQALGNQTDRPLTGVTMVVFEEP